MIKSEPVEAFKEKVKETVKKILPSIEENMTDNINEIWDDLSRIYYKYETNDWKQAFREVIKEISEKVNEDEWHIIYNKLYRHDKK